MKTGNMENRAREKKRARTRKYEKENCRKLERTR